MLDMLGWSVDRGIAFGGTLFGFLGFLAAIGFFQRRNKTIRGLLYVEQERDNFSRRFEEASARLKLIDPERFLDQIAEFERTGYPAAYKRMYDRAIQFAQAQQEALGRAAEIITEEELVGRETPTAADLKDAIRFATIGLAADPENTGLADLRTGAEARLKAVDRGEPQDAIHMDGMSGVELNHLANEMIRKGRYALAEAAARRSVPLALAGSGRLSANFAAALDVHAQALWALGRYSEAGPLYRQALEIGRATLGAGHPDYAITCNNLAKLLRRRGAAMRQSQSIARRWPFCMTNWAQIILAPSWLQTISQSLRPTSRARQGLRLYRSLGYPSRNLR